MKEVQGELNLTVIVVISIGVLATFFFTVLWPMLKGNYQSQTDCKKAVCNCKDDGIVIKDGRKYCTCHVSNDENNTFECVYRG